MGKNILKMLAVALAAAFLSTQAFAATTTPRKVEGGVAPLIEAGADPIDFTLKKLGGGEVALKDLLGKKAAVLVFWSLFCGPCQEELPLMDQLGKKYADKDLLVLAVNLDGEKRAKAVDKYMEKQGFSFSVLWEILDGVNYLTADAYGVQGTPTTVIIGKNGKVTYTHVGQETMDALEKAFQEAISAK